MRLADIFDPRTAGTARQILCNYLIMFAEQKCNRARYHPEVLRRI